MKRIIKTSALVLSVIGLVGTGTAIADSHEEDGDDMVAVPVEMYVCNYADGKTQKDFDAVVKQFNAWGDDAGMNEYTAWQLVPFYFGSEQDFDFLWLGVSPNAASLGRDQDRWLTTGGKIAAEFEKSSPCDQHANFAALTFKEPPERQTPDDIFITFSDCKMHEGVTFNDVAPAIGAWAEYRGEHGSTGGMWVLFPAMGGGGEEFDFKWVTAYDTMEDHGKDWDQYSAEGWKKAEELFPDMLSCDSSRVYAARNLRRAESDD